MPPISWEDLQRLSWAKHQNIETKRTCYTWPNSQTKLYQKRHIPKQERCDYGDTLFPGRGKVIPTCDSLPGSSQDTLPEATPDTQTQPLPG